MSDETYFPLSFKGHRHLSRPAHQRGHAVRQRGTGEEQIPVLVLGDRQGSTADFRLVVASAAEKASVLRQRVAVDAMLCTDAGRRFAARPETQGLPIGP